MKLKTTATGMVSQGRSPAQKLSDRPIVGKLHARERDEIPPLRVVSERTKEFNSLVSWIVSQVVTPELLEKWGATPLDLLSSDGISKERVGEIRQKLLRYGNLHGALRARFTKLLVHRPDFRGLDGKPYNFRVSRSDEERAALIVLNEMYQLSCLSLVQDGMILQEKQLAVVFERMDDFDTFVSTLTHRENPENQEAILPHSPSRSRRYERTINCLIVRNMLNMFDTLMSDKYYNIERDVTAFFGKLATRWIESVELASSPNEWAYSIRNQGKDGFEGTLYISKKSFESIGLKKWSNRKYGNADAMEDMFRLRFEGKRDNADNLTRALDYFARHVFSGEVRLGEKSPILNHTLLTERKKVIMKPKGREKKGSIKTLRQADVTGRIEHEGHVTGVLEFQFQYEGEMECWIAHPLVYDFKKKLTASVRKLGSIDAYNILFYMRQLPLDEIGLTEEDILKHLIIPHEDDEDSEDPLTSKQRQCKKEARSHIEKLWRGEVGFLLPVRTRMGGVRFITQDAYTQDMFRLYPDMLGPAPLVEGSFSYIKQMIDRVDDVVLLRLEDYETMLDQWSTRRESILNHYIPFRQRKKQ